MEHRFTRVLAFAILAAPNGARAASCAEALLSNPTLTRFAVVVQQACLARLAS